MDNIALTEAVFYVLLSLYSPLHGYGIMQKVDGMSNGRVRLAAGTLYGAIGSMLEKGWIQAAGDGNGGAGGAGFGNGGVVGGSRKKEYVITGLGKKVAENELSRLMELVSNGAGIIGGD